MKSLNDIKESLIVRLVKHHFIVRCLSVTFYYVMILKDFRPCDIKGSHGIYEIRNTSNNKIYVGSAVNLRSRFYQHSKELSSGSHHNRFLQNAFNKYGESAFVFSVLEFVKDKTKLVEREQYWMATRL